MALTIGKKLNGLVLLLQICSIGGTVYLAADIFTSDFMDLMRGGTTNTAALFGSRIRAAMKDVADRARTLAAASKEEFRSREDQIKFIEDNLGVDPMYVGLSLYKKGKDGKFVSDWRFLNSDVRTKFKLVGKDLDELDARSPVALESIAKGNVDFNIGTVKGVNLIRIGLPFLQRAENDFVELLIVELQQDRFSSFFKEVENYTSVLTDRTGRILASSNENEKLYKTGASVKDSTIFTKSREDKNHAGNIVFTDAAGEKQMASFQRVGFADLTVISQIPHARAEQGQRETFLRTAELAGIFVFLSLAFGLLFSQGITRPIRMLRDAADRVGNGDFTVRLSTKKNVKSGDEIQQFATTFNAMVTGLQERDQIKNTFAKFHSKEVAEQLLSGNLQLGGERKHAYVFFSDVRGFTSMSERMNPEALVQILNRYMTRMVNVILKNGGVVDKYVGDAIMALWGAPLAKPDDGERALRACLEMRMALAELNEEFMKEGLPPLKIGMALNYGPLIAGNIGSTERMEYTVIGDTVNTASRIESLTKAFGTDLLISQSVVAELPPSRFLLEKTFEAKVKGKTEALVIYKVTGVIDENGRQVRLQTAYSDYEGEKSDKVQPVLDEITGAGASAASAIAPAARANVPPSGAVPPPFRRPVVTTPVSHPAINEDGSKPEGTGSGLFAGTRSFNTGLFAADKAPSLHNPNYQAPTSEAANPPASDLLPQHTMSFDLSAFDEAPAGEPSAPRIMPAARAATKPPAPPPAPPAASTAVNHAELEMPVLEVSEDTGSGEAA
ncbi:MAG: adenylate/guanylate cyclase domain-containing protein [Bacteriovoracia bacterium]